MALEAVGNAALGVDQQIARQTDNAFIRSTTGRGWQFLDGSIGNVNADDGEISVVEFPNVRATPATDSLGAVLVRVRADAFDESHAQYLTIAK